MPASDDPPALATIRASESVGISLPVQDELRADEYLDLATLSEELGFASLFLGEIAGTDAMAMLGAVAARTSRVVLGTGIVSLYSRSVPQLAMGAATLDQLAPNRFVLGLGASTPGVVEGWHARPFGGVAGVESVVSPLRRLLQGERVEVHGEHATFEPFRLMPPRQHRVPIMLGAIGPKMLTKAGEVADAAYLAFCPVDTARERVSRTQSKAAQPVLAVMSLNAYAGTNYKAGLRRMKEFVLRYFLLPTHRRGFTGSRLRDLERAAELWSKNERREAVELVPEEIVQQYAIVGDGQAVAGRVSEYLANGIDHVVLHALGDGDGSGKGSKETYRAVASALGL